jgi:hypothetical protein
MAIFVIPCTMVLVYDGDNDDDDENENENDFEDVPLPLSSDSASCGSGDAAQAAAQASDCGARGLPPAGVAWRASEWRRWGKRQARAAQRAAHFWRGPLLVISTHTRAPFLACLACSSASAPA